MRKTTVDFCPRAGEFSVRPHKPRTRLGRHLAVLERGVYTLPTFFLVFWQIHDFAFFCKLGWYSGEQKVCMDHTYLLSSAREKVANTGPK